MWSKKKVREDRPLQGVSRGRFFVGKVCAGERNAVLSPPTKDMTRERTERTTEMRRRLLGEHWYAPVFFFLLSRGNYERTVNALTVAAGLEEAVEALKKSGIEPKRDGDERRWTFDVPGKNRGWADRWELSVVGDPQEAPSDYVVYAATRTDWLTKEKVVIEYVSPGEIPGNLAELERMIHVRKGTEERVTIFDSGGQAPVAEAAAMIAPLFKEIDRQVAARLRPVSSRRSG